MGRWMLGLLTLTPMVGFAAERFTPECERSALEFVRSHDPELARLLARLKPSNRGEYEKAVVELDGVRESLEKLRKRDPQRYELSLKVWQGRSRAELLAARWAAHPTAEGERELRRAVDRQQTAELELKRYDRRQVAERLRRLDGQIERLEESGKAQADARYESLVKKAQRTRKRRAQTAQAPAASPDRPEEKR